MIGHRSPPRNGLSNPRYIFKKISYIFKKIWYIQSSSYWDPYLPSHGLFVFSGTLGKWLQVVAHHEMNFGTQGTSLRKFGTFNPQAIGTLFLFLRSICFFRDPLQMIRGRFAPHNGLWNPRYILKKIWYI